MKSKHLFIIFYISISTYGQAQNWVAVDTLHLSEKISCYSIDNEHQLYIGTESGNVHRYDENGNENEFFSSIANFNVTSIAGWNRLKIFLFYQNPQEFYLLDRFNTISISYDLQEYSTDLVNMCSPGVDNSLWVLSSSLNEIRKYNLQTRQLLFTTPLMLNLQNVTHMRSFQNLLIISDKQKGLFFFDQYGNLVSQIDLSGIDHFQIKDGQLEFLCDSGIVSMNPYQPSFYEMIKAPEGAFIGLLKSDTNYFLIQSNNILVYRRI